MVPEKVGLKSIQRDGFDYELTVVIDMDINHYATSSKDRTGLFSGLPPFRIEPSTGSKIASWCNAGISLEKVKEFVENAKELSELTEIYKLYPAYYPQLKTEFMAKKAVLTNSFLNQINKVNNESTTRPN
jgi:hypothetical protein